MIQVIRSLGDKECPGLRKVRALEKRDGPFMVCTAIDPVAALLGTCGSERVTSNFTTLFSLVCANHVYPNIVAPEFLASPSTSGPSQL